MRRMAGDVVGFCFSGVLLLARFGGDDAPLSTASSAMRRMTGDTVVLAVERLRNGVFDEFERCTDFDTAGPSFSVTDVERARVAERVTRDESVVVRAGGVVVPLARFDDAVSNFVELANPATLLGVVFDGERLARTGDSRCTDCFKGERDGLMLGRCGDATCSTPLTGMFSCCRGEKRMRRLLRRGVTV